MATGQAGTSPYLSTEHRTSSSGGLSSDRQAVINVFSSTIAVAADAVYTWDVGTGNDQTGFVVTHGTSYCVYAGSGTGESIYFMVGSESPSRFRKLKWKLWDISHSIRRLVLRLVDLHHERQRIKAEAKAQILLDDLFVLVPGQKFIVVPSKIHKDREYRIPIDGSMPQVWTNGKMDHRLCIQISIKHHEHVPSTDLVITRALMAMGAEAEFLRIANKMGSSIFNTVPDLVINER
jgi:hypothetical protein